LIIARTAGRRTHTRVTEGEKEEKGIAFLAKTKGRKHEGKKGRYQLGG